MRMSGFGCHSGPMRSRHRFSNSLAGGSGGNCYFIGTAATRIRIDAGIAADTSEATLKTIGESPEHISTLLLTHEHQFRPEPR